MPDPASVLAEADRLMALFVARGAAVVQTDVLQPADTLLDLYGDDIRGRAYLTADPLRGEMVLRPDFTVPVVQMHMESRADPARYTYQGKVFRKQDHDPDRANEFLQVGFEIFDGQDAAAADAAVFAAIRDGLDGVAVTATCGDIGILMAAVAGLATSEDRKAALRRHIWRPKRFKALLDRYSGRTPPPPSRVALLAADDPFGAAGADMGLRSREEVAARIAALRQDAATPPVSGDDVDLIDAILGLKETVPHVLSALRDIAVDLPAIGGAVTLMARRLDALAARGVDVDMLAFEGSYGRMSLEYYDGFVFGFEARDQPHWSAVATGGRYDALTAQLGNGRAVPAVGGVIRPDLVAALRGDV